jgi:hypothetical protein
MRERTLTAAQIGLRGFHVSDDLREMWDLPDVVGVERR